MAAEGAAQSGSGVAGMVCSLRVLLLVSSVLALEGKREGVPENPHLLVQTQHRWEMGKIQRRQKKTEDIKAGKGVGRVSEKGSPVSCAPAGELQGPGRGVLFLFQE